METRTRQQEFGRRVRRRRMALGLIQKALADKAHMPQGHISRLEKGDYLSMNLVVPKKYLEQVGDDGFKKHPIGLGPYKFVSFTPGVELVLEAFEGYWQTEPLPYNPQKAKQLLAEAGYPNGFDAGDLVPIPPFFEVGEAVVNYLNAVGIRVRMRTMERAAFYSAWREKSCAGSS